MPAPDKVAPGRGLARVLRSRTALLLAFSFAVMADPVSSAALRALNGDLALLVPTMALVVAIIALVILNGAWVRAGRPRGIRNVAAEAEEMSE